jgi:hypothetical protein
MVGVRPMMNALGALEALTPSPLTTWRCAVPDAVRNALGTTTVREVALTKVAASGVVVPEGGAHVTVEWFVNPVPVMVTVVSAPPMLAAAGLFKLLLMTLLVPVMVGLALTEKLNPVDVTPPSITLTATGPALLIIAEVIGQPVGEQ